MSTSNQEELRRRRWRASDVRPVRFLGWRSWVDSRVRLDDATLDAIAGLRLARVALNDRSTSDENLVPDLFDDHELPHRNGFSVSVAAGRRRLDEAERQLALSAFVMYVSDFDELLSAVITMLRRLDIGTSAAANNADRGVSDKLRFLRKHCSLRLEPEHEHLYGFLVEIRNAVVHQRASETPVKRHWDQRAHRRRQREASGSRRRRRRSPFTTHPDASVRATAKLSRVSVASMSLSSISSGSCGPASPARSGRDSSTLT